MADKLIMRGKYLLSDPRRKEKGVLRDGAIALEGGKISEVGPFADLKKKSPQAKVLGDGSQLLMPGLVDAHSHGRGMSPIQKGVKNDFLENALFDWAYMHQLPAELCAGMTAYHHIRSGCTLLHHNGFDDDGPAGRSRAHAAIKVYLDSGIRLAFSPGVRDESKLALDELKFFDTLPPDLKEWAKGRVFYDKTQVEEDYFSLFADLRSRYESEDTRILLSPSWAHGLTEKFARRVVDTAAGRTQIHMHTLQSPVQKAYGLRRHGRPTMRWLDDMGLVARNCTYGHAIHVTQDDIELMGRRGASVTNHPSCNFIMRNGITPVMPMRKAGVNVAMGMDDKTINDDEDAVMELRMMHKVHRLATYDLTEPPMDAYEAFEIATLNGARVCGFEGECGALLPGMQADAVLVDLQRVENEPWLDPRSDIVEAFVQRALGSDVSTVVVGGKVVMQERRLASLDVDALFREVKDYCEKGLSEEHRKRADMLARIKPYAQKWYRGWDEGIVDKAFYRVNSRA
ncbi:MAG TPA: amidohydrolase family protein [Burkholderiales bacterium]|jgi:cytosine/adenosine deaminase-related metal-dependent hydrolase|nr:amidohydrolase family protein [Burkholderiales bacterium]